MAKIQRDLWSRNQGLVSRVWRPFQEGSLGFCGRDLMSRSWCWGLLYGLDHTGEDWFLDESVLASFGHLQGTCDMQCVFESSSIRYPWRSWACKIIDELNILQCFDAVGWVAGPVQNWMVRCWRGYLPGVRCRVAYSPADATATHCIQTGFIFLVLADPGSPGQGGTRGR